MDDPGPLGISEVVRRAHGSLRFSDVRHSYATWLISQGVPVNDVVGAMGHEKATTTLNIYTHRSSGRDPSATYSSIPMTSWPICRSKRATAARCSTRSVYVDEI